MNDATLIADSDLLDLSNRLSVESINQDFLFQAKKAIVTSLSSKKLDDEMVQLSVEHHLGNIFSVSIEDSVGEFSIENRVVDALRRIWRAIWDSIRRFVRTMTDYVRKYFGGADLARKQGLKLQDQIREIMRTAAQPKSSTATTDQGLYLRVDGEILDEKRLNAIKGRVTAVADIKQGYADAYRVLLEKVPKHVNQLLTEYDRTRDEAFTRDLMEFIVKGPETTDKLKDIVDAMRFDELPGGRHLVYIKNESDNGLIRLPSIRIEDMPRAKPATTTPIKVPGYLHLIRCLNFADEILSSIISERVEMMRLIKTIEDVSDKVNKEIGGRNLLPLQTAKEQHYMRNLIETTRMQYVADINQISMYQYQVARSIIIYVGDMLKSY